MSIRPSLLSLIYLLVRPAVSSGAALFLSSPSTPATSDTSKNLPSSRIDGPTSQDDSFSSTGVSNSFCVGDVARERMDSTKPMASAVATAAGEKSTRPSGGTSTAPAAADWTEVPERFLLGCGGDEAEAARRWVNEYRTTFRIDAAVRGFAHGSRRCLLVYLFQVLSRVVTAGTSGPREIYCFSERRRRLRKNTFLRLYVHVFEGN